MLHWNCCFPIEWKWLHDLEQQQQKSLNSLGRLNCGENLFIGSGHTSCITLTWTCLMALGLMTLKARLNDSLDRPPSSVRAVRTRASRSAPTKPWAAWATFSKSSWVMSALASLSANFVRIESRALVLGTQISISTSRRPGLLMDGSIASGLAVAATRTTWLSLDTDKLSIKLRNDELILRSYAWKTWLDIDGHVKGLKQLPCFSTSRSSRENLKFKSWSFRYSLKQSSSELTFGLFFLNLELKLFKLILSSNNYWTLDKLPNFLHIAYRLKWIIYMFEIGKSKFDSIACTWLKQTFFLFP